MAAEQTENKAAHVIHEKEEIGKVIISDEVFSLIAGLAAHGSGRREFHGG